jgi:hypothetical protein
MGIKDQDIRLGLDTADGLADAFRRSLRRERQTLENRLLALDLLQKSWGMLQDLPEGPSISCVVRLAERWNGLPFEELAQALRCYIHQWNDCEEAEPLRLLLDGLDQPGQWRVTVAAPLPPPSLRSL